MGLLIGIREGDDLGMLGRWKIVIPEESRSSVAVVQALHGLEAQHRRLNVELVCIFLLVLATLLLGLTVNKLNQPFVLL